MKRLIILGAAVSALWCGSALAQGFGGARKPAASAASVGGGPAKTPPGTLSGNMFMKPAPVVGDKPVLHAPRP